MANYTTANLVKAQIALQGAMANADRRFRMPEVWKAFIRNAQNFIPDVASLRTREDRAVEANYFLRKSRALGSARTHNHTGTHGDSDVLTPNFATKTDKFAMSLKQADNSIYSLQDELDNEYLNTVANFMEGLDELASDTLVNNLTGVNTATLNGSFNSANDVYEIDWDLTANGMLAAQTAKTVMDINKWQGGNLIVFCDSVAFTKFQTSAAQGAQNSTNYSFQFSGLEFIHDPSLTAKALDIDAGYINGFFIVVPAGTFGALDWIPKQNREGKVTSVNTYSSFVNPFDGLRYALHTYETRADGSSVNGMTQDVITQFEVSLDVALEVAPLSTADATPVFAFALVNTLS